MFIPRILSISGFVANEGIQELLSWYYMCPAATPTTFIPSTSGLGFNFGMSRMAEKDEIDILKAIDFVQVYYVDGEKQ